MFTDVGGYTALMQAGERPAPGQRELAAHDVSVRIGVHVGEVIVEPERLTGEAVNIAARIESFAVPGGVLLSDSAYEQIRNRRDGVLVGPGGVGKTRLVVELGRLLAPEFLDGVSFVELADVTEAADFLPAVAEALDVKEAAGRSLGDGLAALLGDKTALLLLDNFEQVVSAAPDVAGLVGRCPGLRIVTTSRTPLRIAAEREYPLATLEPARAIELFVERARATKREFELAPENTDAVAAVCRRLDGLPLALELAAARLRLLPPEALLERLGHALDVLSSGR